MLEFRTAHSQAMKDKVQRIIIIKADELPKKIDPSIKAYLDSTTYVTWGDENFWNKLLNVIPSHDCTRSTAKKHIGDMETLL